jgi:lysophospholipase L1-like esterase
MKEMRPRHIVLFIACCFALVGGLVVLGNLYRPLLGDIRCPEVGFLVESRKSKVESQEVLASTPGIVESDTTETLVPMELADSIGLEEEILAESQEKFEVRPLRCLKLEVGAKSQEDVQRDNVQGTKVESGVLELFIAGLQEAENKQVRVVHYGDSQIEEDRITSTLRSHLQEQYGGIGPGLLPLVQTIPTRTVVQSLLIDGQRVTPKNGPQRWLVYGPKAQQRDSNNHYGVMGQVAVLDSLCDSVTVHFEPYGKLTKANYFSQMRVIATPSIVVDGSRQHKGALRDTLTRLNIDLCGIGEVYGISLESPSGVIVDNIPMRGGSGNVFTKINRKQLTDFFAETNTRLIILQFGGNVMPWANTEERVRSYAYSMRKQIRYLRECAPNASLLFIGPSDMLTVVDGEKRSYPTIAYMDQQLARAAAAEGIAYWSLFKAMGGEGSMLQWQEKGLASSDGVHFYRSGANKAGELLWAWLKRKIEESK